MFRFAVLAPVVAASRVGKCGIASTVNQCAADLSYLSSFGDTSHINCMGYGGPVDPCTLNIHNDADEALGKDPSNCNNGVLILWDEPATQGKSAQWAAQKWAQYVSRWSSQLRSKRNSGMLITTPMFNNVDHMSDFFAACPSCSNQNSDQYIDVIIWNAWLGAWGDVPGEVAWITQQSAAMKLKYNNRPVWLGNFAYLGADATGQKELDSLYTIGNLESSGIDSVYYFAAQDFGGGTPDGTNYLRKAVGGTTIGKEFMKICAGATPPSPHPAPSPSSAACSAHPACSGLDGDCCPTGAGVTLGCCGSSPSPGPVPSPSPSGASCSEHPGCSGLQGDCCPTTDGVTLGCCYSGSLGAVVSPQDSPWEDFKLKFQKVYNGDDEEYRHVVFQDNMARYSQQMREEPGTQYGPTIFSDWTREEFKSTMLTYTPAENSSMVYKTLEVDMSAGVAASRDWTGKYTTPIKDQGQCGSCWAFSATEQIESDAMRQHGWSGMLSAQELNDCTESGGRRNGCGGGDPTAAYKVVEALGGIASDKYKYTATNQDCKYRDYAPVVKVVDWHHIDGGDAGLKSYLSSTGPISVCLDASDWDGYKGGIKTTCTKNTDHCVQYVGYGTDGSTDYFKVRNSWNTWWGENGYIRLKIGEDCASGAKSVTSTSVIGPAPGPSPSPSAACSAHPACSGLDGDCCPTGDGVTLGCCGASPSPGPVPSPSPSGASCSEHPGCSTLQGDCCPTSSGVTLDCCNAEMLV